MARGPMASSDARSDADQPLFRKPLYVTWSPWTILSGDAMLAGLSFDRFGALVASRSFQKGSSASLPA